MLTANSVKIQQPANVRSASLLACQTLLGWRRGPPRMLREMLDDRGNDNVDFDEFE
jgi:hypothetical protein